MNMEICTREDIALVSQGKPFAYVVWCFWYTGTMNENRQRGLQMMKENLGVPVCLVTSENIHKFVLPDYPLHPAFEYLSDVHKSDYMRIYLLHHYGGGWHDVKPTEVSFREVWKEFDDSEVYLIGRPEIKNGPARVFDKEGRWMPDCWTDLVGCGWWVGRPNTLLSSEMMKDIHLLLDENLELLKKYPAKTPYDKKRPPKVKWLSFLASDKGYPLPWTVFGNVFHPLNYKYRKHVRNTLPADKIKNSGLPFK